LRKTWTRWLTFLALALGLAATPALADASGDAPEFALAVMEAPVGTSLDDILTGRAQPGFTPLLTPGFEFDVRDGRELWVRVRTDLPPAPEGGWQIGVLRVPLDRIYLRTQAPWPVAAERSFFAPVPDATPWPHTFEFPLPTELQGPSEVYLQLQGRVRGGLHVRLRSAETAVAEEVQARGYFRFVYALFLLVGLLSLARHFEDPRSSALAVGAASICALLACMGVNGHVYALPEGALLAGLGAPIPQALLLLGAGPLVLATRQFSGLAKSAPGLVRWMRGLGWLLFLAAIYGLFVSSTPPGVLQVAAWIAYAVAGLACLLMLLLDPRSHRWIAVLALMATGGAVLVRVLADRQFLPGTLYSLYGWQLLMALMLFLFLMLPWVRAHLQRWAIRKRAIVPEPSTEEKIAIARERLVASLQSGLKNAADGDLTWIAFRRLLEGLKPVLDQTSAAVVAMRFHGEDQLQVEPPDAEERYRELLAQRSTLLKNLSRLRAPQQIGIDFDGPTGPLEVVQLAVIPLPIPRPGWGALLVERAANVTYSDAELALCAEFAAVAIMAGDEAASTVSAQRQAETDPATGVYRTEALRAHLAKLVDIARQKQQPLSVLYFALDQLPALRESGGEVGAAAGLRPLAETLREEADYGDLIGRWGSDGLLLVTPGKRLLPARDYADRLRAAISRMDVDPRVAVALTVSVGVAQASPNERDPEALVDRAAKASLIAVKNGGNQIFS
jgi:diguanylate cyclase (GGDEF)-like protein